MPSALLDHRHNILAVGLFVVTSVAHLITPPMSLNPPPTLIIIIFSPFLYNSNFDITAVFEFPRNGCYVEG